jgi:hypothetical protein
MMNDLSRCFRWRVPGLKPLAVQRYFTGLKPGASSLVWLKPASTSADLKPIRIFVDLARVLKKSDGREVLRTSGAEAPFSLMTLLRGLKPSPASKPFCSIRSSAFAYHFRDENEFPPRFTGGD